MIRIITGVASTCGNMASLNRLARCSGCTFNVNVPLVPNGIWRTQLSSTCGVIRPTLISGDFFVSIPEADIHILKYIIYDWNDEQSLKNLAGGATKDGHAVRPAAQCLSLRLLLVIDTLVSKLPELYLNFRTA